MILHGAATCPSGADVRRSSGIRWPASTAAIAVLVAAVTLLGAAWVPAASHGPGRPGHRASTAGALRARGLGVLPAALKAAVSRRLGRDGRRYWISGPPAHLHGAGPGIGIHFSRGGVSVATTHGRLVLSLDGIGRAGAADAVGRAGALAAVPAVPPALSAHNTVHYRHAGIDEWYVNGPAGLEQGFTLRRPLGPAAAGGPGPLTLALGLGHDLHASVDPGARSATLRDNRGDVVLSYRGLTVRDRSGAPVPAHLALSGARLAIEIDDRGADYPLTVDPFVQMAGLTVTTGAANNALGTSVAMTSDTVVVGAPGVGSGTGAVYVYVKPGGGWADTGTPDAKLTSSDSQSGDRFGSSVAIQNDTIVVGAPHAAVGAHASQGAAYVFVRPGAAWSTTTAPTAKLSDPAGQAGDDFGTSVALDGTTIVVGAPSTQVGAATGAGVAAVFVKPNGGWVSGVSPDARLSSSAPAGDDRLGTSVAISGDTIVAGAPQAIPEPGTTPFVSVGTGKVGLFVEPEMGWSSKTQDTWLTIASGATGQDQLGLAVAMSGDTIVAGAPQQFSNGFPGSGYVFYRPDGNPPFSPTTPPAVHLTTSTVGDEDQTGASVAIDGSTIVLGAPSNLNFPAQGSQYVYLEPVTGWQDHPPAEDQAPFAPADVGANDGYGQGTAVAGPYLAGGSPGHTVGANANQGKAYVWQTAGPNSATVATQATNSTAATLAATVNPLGGTITDCHFDYGPTRAYGQSAPCVGTVPSGGTTDVAVSAPLAGLTPATIYHYRISTTEATVSHFGADMTFRTPGAPVLTAAPTPAVSITKTSATLQATVNPNGQQVTNCHFEYGPTSGYGASVPCASSPGAGTTNHTVTAAVGGLSPRTTYHFRVVATNATGTGNGPDQNFDTAFDPAPANTAAPTLSGKAEQGQTLTESHGGWTNNPTGYSYTWQDCDRSGAHCQTIAGAGGQHYTLTGSDTGHTIRVQERATNLGGTSAAASSAASAVVTAAPPVNGKTVVVGLVSGRVTIKLPGRRKPIPLTANQAIPVGATVDATHGRVRLTAEKSSGHKTQTAEFYGAAFIVGQAEHHTVTTLRLTGGARCVAGKLATVATAAKHKPRRSLFGSGHGNYTTQGSSASATVRGTIWETADYCDGSTLIVVKRGTVSVRDFVRKRTLLVHAGHSYLASAKK